MNNHPIFSVLPTEIPSLSHTCWATQDQFLLTSGCNDNTVLNCESKKKLTKVNRIKSWIQTPLRIWSHISFITDYFCHILSSIKPGKMNLISLTGSHKMQLNNCVLFDFLYNLLMPYFLKSKRTPPENKPVKFYCLWGFFSTFLSPGVMNKYHAFEIYFLCRRDIFSKETPRLKRVGSQHGKFCDLKLFTARHIIL